MNPETPAVVRFRRKTSCPPRESEQATSSNSSGFDARTVAQIRDLVRWLVRAPHLKQEREDYIQEALLRFWQVMGKSPKIPHHSLSHYWRSFILDILRRGKSLDSPKRRWLGCSLDVDEVCPSSKAPDELVSTGDPSQEASASDDLIQILVRLSRGDQEILRLLVEGNGTREVARRLHISPSGVGKSKLRIQFAAAEIGLFPKNGRCPGPREK